MARAYRVTPCVVSAAALSRGGGTRALCDCARRAGRACANRWSACG
jgi:hypothetical protein